MGDEEVFAEDDIAGVEDTEVSQKTGILPGIVIKILKWVVLGLAAVVFIVTVVVITTSIMNQGVQSQSYPAVSPEYEAESEILQWFAVEEIRGRTADDHAVTVMVTVKLGYKLDDKNLQTEIGQRAEQIYEIIRLYFGSKYDDDLKPQDEPGIKQDLIEKINRILSTGKIKEIIFKQFQTIEF